MIRKYVLIEKVCTYKIAVYSTTHLLMLTSQYAIAIDYYIYH